MRTALAALVAVSVLAGCSSGDGRLGAYGVSAKPPTGWHASIGRGALLAATFRLPPARDWTGDRAAGLIGPAGVVVSLLEDAPGSGRPAVHRPGLPLAFRARDFRFGSQGAHVPGGHLFAVRAFRLSGRLFYLRAESSRGGVMSCGRNRHVRGRYDVSADVFFGTRHPSPALRARAQAEFDRIQLPDWPAYGS